MRAAFESGALPDFITQSGDAARVNAWADASNRAYQSGWNCFAKTCATVDINITTMSIWTPEYAEHVVSTFVVLQLAYVQLSPRTIKEVYLPGIAVQLDQQREAAAAATIRAATKSREVKALLKGFERFYDKCNPQAGRDKLPFCMDMALMAREVLQSWQFSGLKNDSIDHSTAWQRVFVSMSTGISFMLRKSEHIGSKDYPPIKRRVITFFDAAGYAIPYAAVGYVQAGSVLVNVTFAKTDQSGFGRRTRHIRQPGTDEACIVQILERWIRDTRDGYGAAEDDELYHVPGLAKFDVDILHQVMAATTQRAGLDGGYKNPTSHSLRYGGATMMAAAGFPQYMIAHYGGWTADSKSLKKYANPTEAMLLLVSKHMSDMARVNFLQHFIMDATARRKGAVRTEARK